MSEPILLTGTPVVPGVAYGSVVWARSVPEPPTNVAIVPEEERASHEERFEQAADKVADRLADRAALATGHTHDILLVASVFARDRGWRSGVEKHIREGVPATQATVKATQVFVDIFTAQGGMMAERITDLIDMRNRVIAELEGLPEPGIPTPESPIVLFANDLSPADTAGLDPSLILGIVTKLGGPTSHTSIIARQLGIPAIVAVEDAAEATEGSMVLIDGQTGHITVGPDEADARRQAETDKALRAAAASWSGPAQSKDGHPIELLCNVQDSSGADVACQTPASGVGLFRTELEFLHSVTEPSIEHQTELYARVLARFSGRKVVTRTLDAGSDKPILFASLPAEDNPALGMRGLRTTRIDEGHLVRQLDAIAKASSVHDGPDWVMAPMVSTVEEARWFASLVRERSLSAGIMIEVPAAAILINQFLAEVDFVSIGTNDLTQYVMAADRLSSYMASYTDSWQPAVLSLISHSAKAGVSAGKPVGVCGEAAADPLLAAVLLGMGITSLSMAPSAIGTVGSFLETLTMEDMGRAAEAALSATSPTEARDRVREALGQ